MRFSRTTCWVFTVVFATLAIVVVAYSRGFLRPRMSERELLWRAKAAMDLDKPAEAAEHLDQLLRRNPRHDEACLYRAQLYRDAGDDESALTVLRNITVASGTVSATARFLEGAIDIAQHRAVAAERHFRDSIRLSPRFVQPYQRLVQLYALQFRRGELLAVLDELSRVRPLGLAEQALSITAGERLLAPAGAIPMLERFVQTDPNDLPSLMALGLYFRDDLQTARAISTFRRVLAADPNYQWAKITLAQMHIDRQEFAAAANLLRTTSPDVRSPPDHWLVHGAWFVAREDWRSAATCFAEAACRDPLNRAAFNQLGLALKRMGNSDDSQLALARAVKLAQLRELFETLGIMHARNQLQAGTIWKAVALFRELGDERHAEAWQEQARQLDPNSVPSRVATTVRGDSAEFVKRFRGAPPQIELVGSSQKSMTSAVPGITPRFQFQDEAAQRGLDFRYFNGASGSKYLIESMGGGVGVIDFDADGWPDLFFPQGRSLPFREENARPDRLFRNIGGERFAAVPDSSGIGDPRYGLGVAVGDFDNDGFDDLMIGNFGRNTLLRNQGDGTFVDETETAGLLAEEMTTSVGWADLDRDGFLDLFIVNYVDGLKICRNDRGEISACSPSNHGGVSDRVYRNLGDGRFADISREIGLVEGGKGLGVVLADLDDDGWMDAMVANDTTPNFFYRNRAQSELGRRQFSEEALTAGIALSETGVAQAGMGIACGDLNGDLKLDLYVTYFYREANGLYLNVGDGLFREETRTAQLYQPTFGWLGFGTQAVDFDLDGWPELFVANGHIDDQRVLGTPWKMPPQLFWRKLDGQYAEVSRESGDYFHAEYLGRGVARFDWNRDGRPDLIVAHQDDPVALLTNQTPQTGSALRLHLRGVTSNRNAIGAKLLVTAGGRTQRVDLNGGDGFLCSNDRALVIGIGNFPEAETVEIHWPSAHTDRFSGLSTQQTWLVREGEFPLRQSSREAR